MMAPSVNQGLSSNHQILVGTLNFANLHSIILFNIKNTFEKSVFFAPFQYEDIHLGTVHTPYHLYWAKSTDITRICLDIVKTVIVTLLCLRQYI